MAIDRPDNAVDGEYNYVAHLDHFSTYVISAPESAPPGSGGSGGSGSGSVSSQANFVVRLADSMQISESQEISTTGTVEEELDGMKFEASLMDSLALLDRTIGYSTLRVGENTTALVRVSQITYGSILPPGAKAIIEANLQNGGTTTQEFTLTLHYSSGNGGQGSTFEISRLIRLGPGEARTELFDVPFGEPGSFDLVAQARTAAGEELAVTHIMVTVPWTTVYFYLIIAIAAPALVVSAALALYLMKKTFKTRRL